MPDIVKDENHDWLTGLCNRRHAMRTLDDMVEAVNYTFPTNHVGIVLADIFSLKQLGDNYGHAPTDEVIKKVGQVFQQHARPEDTACRYGGDEFLLIIPRTDIQYLQERAEQIKQAASNLHVYLGEQPREKIRLSIGVAIWPPEDGFNPRPTALWGAEGIMHFAEQDLQSSRNHYLQEDFL